MLLWANVGVGFQPLQVIVDSALLPRSPTKISKLHPGLRITVASR